MAEAKGLHLAGRDAEALFVRVLVDFGDELRRAGVPVGTSSGHAR